MLALRFNVKESVFLTNALLTLTGHGVNPVRPVASQAALGGVMYPNLAKALIQRGAFF